MKFNFSILLIAASISLFACETKNTSSASIASIPDQNGPTVVNINTDSAKKMIADTKDLVILDVRTPGEVSQGILPNAKVIDINNPEFEKLVAQLDKNKPTLVYCKAGARSKRACDTMKKMGFKSLYNLEGGYDSWR